MESILKQPSPKAEKLPKVKFEKGELIMDVKGNIIKMVSQSVVSKAISVGSIYYYTHTTMALWRSSVARTWSGIFRCDSSIAQIAQTA